MVKMAGSCHTCTVTFQVTRIEKGCRWQRAVHSLSSSRLQHQGRDQLARTPAARRGWPARSCSHAAVPSPARKAFIASATRFLEQTDRDNMADGEPQSIRRDCLPAPGSPTAYVRALGGTGHTGSAILATLGLQITNFTSWFTTFTMVARRHTKADTLATLDSSPSRQRGQIGQGSQSQNRYSLLVSWLPVRRSARIDDWIQIN